MDYMSFTVFGAFVARSQPVLAWRCFFFPAMRRDQGQGEAGLGLWWAKRGQYFCYSPPHASRHGNNFHAGAKSYMEFF